MVAAVKIFILLIKLTRMLYILIYTTVVRFGYGLNLYIYIYIYISICDFPGGSDSKASVYNAGDLGSIPGSGRSAGEGNGNPYTYTYIYTYIYICIYI